MTVEIESHLIGDDGLVYIIETNHDSEDRFIVIKDDAYKQSTGESELLTKKQIKEKYKIEVVSRRNC